MKKKKSILNQRYVESLERVIQKDYEYLKSITGEFQEKCRLAASATVVPSRLLTEIPDTYREIRTRLKETQAVQSLLKAKYSTYSRNETERDKEIRELDLNVGSYFSKFLHALKQSLGEKESADREKLLESEKEAPHFQWFRNQENLVKFLRNVRILNELDYEMAPARVREKRKVTKDKARSLTLFIFKGDAQSIADLQSRMQLREHDILERYDQDELRGILIHLREIQLSEVERIFDRLKEVKGYSGLKCLLIPIRSERDLGVDLSDWVEKIINEMAPGELKTLNH
jgi:hypothetical protein